MTFKDFLHIQNYFHGEENRDPSMTEIRVLDTYWSDHCRHTTFQTELKNISFEDGDYKKPIENTYKAYKETHDEMYKGRDDKFVCLMDIALLAMKKLKEEGKLDDMEVSDEINACSIVVPVDDRWKDRRMAYVSLKMKHITIQQKLSLLVVLLHVLVVLSEIRCQARSLCISGYACYRCGRSYSKPVKDTIKGKLPQRKIVTGAANRIQLIW